MLDYEEAKEYAFELVEMNSQRNVKWDKMEDQYWMRWPGEDRARRIKDVKITKSPRLRNAIKGAMQLLTAADPQITVPEDENAKSVKPISSKLEKWARATWFQAGRVRGNPLHYDMVLSAFLYSEVHVGIMSTLDLVDSVEGGSEAQVNRMKNIRNVTPYMFEVYNPRYGYADYDTFGMRAFLQQYERTAHEIMGEWGSSEEVKNYLRMSSEDKKMKSKYTYNSLYDLTHRYVWVDDHKEPFLAEPHDLPFIPFVATRVDGSTLFSKEADRREPFLWTIVESGIPERQNLVLTVLYTLAYQLGANPTYVAKVMDPNRVLEVDHRAGGIIKIRPDEDLRPLQRDVIDPSLIEAWRTAIELEMESTIYRQTLGAPVTGETYSGTALLHQAGRLPLTVPQKKVSWAIGEALTKAMIWMKKTGGQSKAAYEEMSVTLEKDDIDMIPDDLQVRAELDLAMPHDTQAAANAAVMLTTGENPLVSKEWALENLMRIHQPDEEMKKIWKERILGMEFTRNSLQMQQEIAMLEQMVMQPGQASGIPGMPGMTGPMQGQGMAIPPAQGSPPNLNGQPPTTPDGFPYAEPMPPINQGPSPEDIV